ncbi:hypothetical protein ALC53_07308 [Atta colombica]|uniref:Uncharacterized protein n=1 Tax=Atta colombica TaxID=520822 RepID=A0A195BDP6_9HYME|nr:hypothetical protein ALC53_07308 [Atta colombica]
MHLMTYISPRVAIWGPFCVPPVYVAHGKSCARACPSPHVIPPITGKPVIRCSLHP